jgi:CRP/FNR family cyclic AMP-dependent transcriptional regulator
MTVAHTISPDDLETDVLMNGLSADERGVVAEICSEIDIDEGDRLIREGADDRHLYALRSGTVRVEATDEDGEPRELAVLQPGALLGELALVVGRPRSADVVAREACTLLRLDAEAFLGLRESESLVAFKIEHNILEHLIDRQTELNQRLVQWLRDHDAGEGNREPTDDIAQLRDLAEQWKF